MANSSSSSSSSSSSRIETISILVVDDDNTCLSIVAAILKTFNYQVVAVRHARDALITLRLAGGTFDLVVSDVHMPDMNGFELQQVITEEFDVPVILMSADEKEGVAMRGLEGGAAFFIMKPVSPDDVRDLWQFAVMKKGRNQNVIIEETCHENGSNGEGGVEEEMDPLSSASSSGEGGATSNKKESKKKNPRREGSDEEKNGGTKKKTKIVWTNSLHNHFLEAIRSIGLDKAVPKKILEVMSTPGLTRENVASHLQKYRIFLRRVSEASSNIQYSPRKGLRMSFNSRCASSSPTQFGQSRLFSNNGRLFTPPMGTSTLTPRAPCIRRKPNSYEARALTPSHIANVGQDHSNIANTSTYGVPAQNNSTRITYQTCYVGYKLSNLQRCGGITGFPRDEPHDAMVSNASIVENYEANNNSQELLSNGVADNRVDIQESALSPIYDLTGLNTASSQRAFDESCFENTWPNQLTNVLDQPQHIGGETNISSNLYDVVQWNNFVNASFSFDQAFNQSESSQLELMTNSQGLATSSRIKEIVLAPNNERNDDDFLESLLAPCGEDHYFHGSNNV